MKTVSVVIFFLLGSCLCASLEIGSDGEMHKARRSIFPVADAGNDAGTWRFELPPHGFTVLVRGQKSGRVLRKLSWNGEKSQEEK